jgi:hypothetical protein
MFVLSKREADSLILQSARSKTGRGGRRKLPSVFTELGVAMLSSVLTSERAVQMNIEIMRAFVRMRGLGGRNKKMAARLEKLEQRQTRVSSVIEVLVEDIDPLASEVKQMKALPAPRKRRIGF